MARFSGRGEYSAWFCPAVANTSAPTRAELTAGTEIIKPGSTSVEAVAAMSGWDSSVDFIAVPDGNSKFNKTIPGSVTAGNPTMEFYSDKVAEPVQTALAENTIGYMVFAFKGDTAGRPAHVWHVQVGGNNEMPDLGNTAHKFRVQFAALSEPDKSSVIPAP